MKDSAIYLKKGIKKYLKSEIESLEAGDLSREDIIRRLGDFYGQYYYFESSGRLMEMAERQIIQTHERGNVYERVSLFCSQEIFGAKGRMNRVWWSPKGGIYLCISLFPRLGPENQFLYNLAIAVSICQVLLDIGIFSEIRWLNDILISRKKVCGCLSKTITIPKTHEKYILFGIGLNVNQKDFPSNLRPNATSLFLEMKREFDPLELLARIGSKIAINFSILEQWEAEVLKDLWFKSHNNPIISCYRTFSSLENRLVAYGLDLERNKGDICVSRGIDEKGGLRLLRPPHDEFTVNVGEIRFLD